MTAQAKSTGGVWDALLNVQRETKTLPKDAQNPHFRSTFTPLDTIVETVSPVLQANDLVWTTLPRRNDHGFLELAYELRHVPSGEQIEDAIPLLLADETMQALGSAITYARRYALSAVLNLVSDDDDGNAASQPANGTTARATPPSPGPKPITEPQKKRLAKALRDSHTTTAQQIRAATRKILGREVSGAELQDLTSREASKLIDGLDAGALPDPEHPSDIPDEQEQFEVPTAAVGTDPDGQPFEGRPEMKGETAVTRSEHGMIVVPAEPFVRTLRAEHDKLLAHVPLCTRMRPDNEYPATGLLAARAGVAARRMHGYLRSLNGDKQPKHTDWYRLQRVEQVLQPLGIEPWMIYPLHMVDDLDDPEPDRDCQACGTVTPIHGVCPWCDELVDFDTWSRWVRTRGTVRKRIVRQAARRYRQPGVTFNQVVDEYRARAGMTQGTFREALRDEFHARGVTSKTGGRGRPLVAA